MKILGLDLAIKRLPKPLPAEYITLLDKVEQFCKEIEAARGEMFENLAAMELNVKETRTRLETIYRKVYRDAARDDEIITLAEAEWGKGKRVIQPGGPVRPGDPVF